ncbi:hypothetical protein [Phenylobacterium sp.]|uniref:hypothetical protein n=1 Tax=Phenylobacterium sp. TaxID=1871053 RepID=UPI0039311706
MWVKIIRDRDYTPPDNRRVTVAYKAGWEGPIKRAWGLALVGDGDATEIEAPPRPAEPTPETNRDADGDGHDDRTGEFVAGNTAARRRRAKA